MATVRLGFLFFDNSFFNTTVTVEYWRNLQIRQDSEFYLQTFGIVVDNPYLKQIQEGGFEASTCRDGQLYYFKDATLSSNCQQPAPPASTVVTLPAVMPESDSSQSPAGCSDNRATACVQWSHAAVLVLLETYREHRHHFENPVKKRKEVWRDISRILNKKDYNYTGDECDKKWRSLTHRYKTIKHSTTDTMSKRRRWEFYEHMGDLLANYPSIQPSSTVASDDGTDNCKTVTTASLETSSTKGAIFNRKRNAPGDAPKVIEALLKQQNKQNQLMKTLIEVEKEKNQLLKSLLEKL